MPLSPQLAIPPEHENAKIRRARWLAKLRRYGPIEIGHREDIFARVTCDTFRVVSRLEPPCLYVDAVPNERGSDPPPNHKVPRETNNRNHPVIGVTQTIIGNAITHGACLLPICGCGQHHHCHVSIGGGKFLAINIDKTQRISYSARKRSVEKPGWKEK